MENLNSQITLQSYALDLLRSRRSLPGDSSETQDLSDLSLRVRLAQKCVWKLATNCRFHGGSEIRNLPQNSVDVFFC